MKFNHWAAYIILAQGHQEQFNKYCESCGFTREEINNIINQTV
jgi:hypothetical protein